MKSPKNRREIFAFGILGIVIICCLFSILLYSWKAFFPNDHWKQQTSPLRPEVISDLCKKLDLSDDDPLCLEGSEVYAPEFFPAIRSRFQLTKSTYDDVQSLLGDYQSKYEPPIALSTVEQYYRAWYDLRGDGATALIFFIDQDGRVFRILEYYPWDESEQ